MTADTDADPLRIGVVLYPGFQALDVFGPLDVFNTLSRTHPATLSLLSTTLDPVSTTSPRFPNAIGQSIVPTHTYASAPPLDLLLIPGGVGARGSTPALEQIIPFIRDTYPKLKYLVTVCTGSWLAARAGVLDGKHATTNKMMWGKVTALSERVQWVPHARWVTDGNIWTSSGVSAGIDVALAWVERVYGDDVAQDISDYLEYDRHKDAEWDPFAELYGLK